MSNDKELQVHDDCAHDLPSKYGLKQVVHLKFRPEDKPITATVRGIHFYPSKTKYDLGLWLGDGSEDNPEYEARIYNVDDVFVHDAFDAEQ